ncbi:MAG: ATP-grasp domain-containing protein, partial [Limnobacter sp.]|nr:ATP-grasp domain-containing protein [Limnobacter sp.]
GRFFKAIGFEHGFFNMEFFYDEATGSIKVIEFNPRMASQFSDLYRRVNGIDLHEMALALAHGIDPKTLAVQEPVSKVASSFVYRSFEPDSPVTMPGEAQLARLKREFPDHLLFQFPKLPGQIARDFKWLKSYRYGILHLGGQNAADLEHRCRVASDLLGWPAPYLQSPDQLPGLSTLSPAWNDWAGTKI